jgi:hypothetical protein
VASPKNKKVAAYQPSGDVKRIIPLKANYAYLNDHLGKLHHLERDSEQFVKLCIEVDEAMDGRITQELNALKWTSVLEKMQNFNNQEAQ